jgi:hypothetical protein
MAIPLAPTITDTPVESSSSAVNWAPVLAGAFVAAAITLLLMLVGAGLGLTLVSPWSGQGSSVATFGIYAAIWLVVVQWLSAGLGGYLTGRLRTKWVGVHTHEVYFRDTAHGFLTWAVATVVVAMFAGSTIGSIVSAGAQTAASAVGATTSAAATVASNAAPDFSTSYFTDALLRPNASATATPAAGNDERTAAEVSRILANGALQGEIPADDRLYLEQTIAARTGLTPDEAKSRVDSVLKSIDAAKVKAQQAADMARKAASTTSLLAALSLLIGAFIASAAAALGGRQRDDDEDRYTAL